MLCSQLTLVQQVELIDTNMLGPKLVRGLVKVAREVGYGCRICTNGSRSEITQPQFFQHAFAKCSHVYLLQGIHHCTYAPSLQHLPRQRLSPNLDFTNQP